MPILLIAVVALAALAFFISRRPDDFKVTRKAAIAAPPAEVFAQVNDFHKWDAWSPWAKLDPNAKNTFSGAEAGTGAALAWAGNKKVGVGSMTITDSRPSEQILIRLEFTKPFKAVNTTEFTFAPEGGKTLVTWTMSGKNNFMSKAMSLVMDCEKMVGPQFEKGLTQMAAIVEKK
jgi:uncharacterized protein YndB with AHSA1/START domain